MLADLCVDVREIVDKLHELDKLEILVQLNKFECRSPEALANLRGSVDVCPKFKSMKIGSLCHPE